MLRVSVLLCCIALLSACASRPTSSDPIEALKRAQLESKIRAEAQDYARFTIARYAELTGDPITAAENYAKLVDRARDDVAIAERAIFASLLINDFQTAASKAGRLPDDKLAEADLARITLAVEAISKGRNKNAIGHLNGPWNSPFHSVMARSLLAWVAFEADPEAAISLQAGAGDNDPILSSVARTLAAVMLANSNHPEKALEQLETLWDEQIRFAIGVDALARLLATEGETEKALARLKVFRDTIGRNPALTDLTARLEADQIPVPPTYTTRAGAALAVYTATAALADQSETDLPAVYFTLALALDPDLHAARTLSARALDNAQRFEEAEALLAAIPESSIYHTNAQGQLAWIKRRQGQNVEALRLANATLERTNDRNIRIQLADLYQSLDRHGEAAFVLTQVIEADKLEGRYDWRLFFARGAARERMGEWPRAENDLQTARGLNPGNATILNYLGYGWISRGMNLDEGLELIEQALRLNPRSGAITDSLGWAHYQLGNYDRAVFYLERATELSPQDPEILDHLGDAYWQVGRYTEAGYQWQRALLYLETGTSEHTATQNKLSTGLNAVESSATGQDLR
jgi:tetratricopeptide (TPR) repeat protein